MPVWPLRAKIAYFQKCDKEVVPADSSMPILPDFGVFFYVRDNAPELALQLAGFVRDEYELMAPPGLKNKPT